MNQNPSVGARHYQAACGLALAAIFLIQYLQNLYLPLNLLMLCIGAAGILYRLRLTPLLVFLTMAMAHLMEQNDQNQFFNPDLRPFRFLEMTDVLLCVATLTFLIAHYRLHALWFHVLAYDVREHPKDAGKKEGPAPQPQARSESTMTPEELAWLVTPIPGFVLAAELCAVLLKQRWTLAGLPPRWRQFMALAWMVLIVMFAAAHFFRHWRRLRMDRATAQLMLQDDLWNETRGEQRRIQRWIVWKKLKKQEEH